MGDWLKLYQSIGCPFETSSEIMGARYKLTITHFRLTDCYCCSLRWAGLPDLLRISMLFTFLLFLSRKELSTHTTTHYPRHTTYHFFDQYRKYSPICSSGRGDWIGGEAGRRGGESWRGSWGGRGGQRPNALFSARLLAGHATSVRAFETQETLLYLTEKQSCVRRGWKLYRRLLFYLTLLSLDYWFVA